MIKEEVKMEQHESVKQEEFSPFSSNWVSLSNGNEFELL